MSFLSDLPIEELYRILDCKKLKKVHKIFDEYEERFEAFSREPILESIRQQYDPIMVKFPVMHNLFSLIWNVPSLPIVALLAILQATALSITAVIASPPAWLDSLSCSAFTIFIVPTRITNKLIIKINVTSI